MKKVLLLVIDAWTSRTFLSAVRNGDLPHFQALIDAGTLKSECIAVFPSLTPAATASLITGRYPETHGILGFHWYDLEEDRVIYYGDDFWLIWREGFRRFFEDFLINLNQHRLKCDTLFKQAECSDLETASFNYIIFHSDVEHKITVPRLLRLLPGVPGSGTVYGPSIMHFGDFVNTPLIDGDTEVRLKNAGGLFHRFGFDDDNTMSLLLQFAETQSFPDFSVAYCPDHDFKSHEVGPGNATSVLENLDRQLGQLFSIFGGLEKFLSEFCLIVTGDHSQTDILTEDENAGIKLDEILDDFSQAEVGKEWRNEDQLMICPDMRSAQIYLRELEASQIEHVAALLNTDPRVDQVIWRAEYSGLDENTYIVSTLQRGRLHFWPGNTGAETAQDIYGNDWSWHGDLRTVDAQHTKDNRLTFSDYPNAFERIVGGLNCKNSGHIWITARPGYEFQLHETSIHAGGGSHGSLHRHDSVSPLLMAGLPDQISPPAHPRSIDVAPFCARILGI